MKLLIVVIILSILISRRKEFLSPVSATADQRLHKHIAKQTKHILISIVIVLVLLSAVLLVSSNPRLKANRLYEKDQFLNNAFQLYLWISSKGEDAILVDQTKVWFAENKMARLDKPYSDNADYLIQNKIEQISYCDGFMDLKLGETLSGRIFSIRMSDKTEAPRDNHSYHMLGQHAIDGTRVIYVYYYEGYDDFNDMTSGEYR